MTKKIDVCLTINGRVYERSIEPRYLLADFIRHEIGLKGTHIGCEHGVCGACTVLIDGSTARSCLHFAAALDGAQITTVEGLASEDALHPIQEAFHQNHALQCGFCTPGFLMTTYELLRDNPNPDQEQIRTAMSNNMCRCTGYTNIVRAVADSAKKLKAQSGQSDSGT